MYGQDQNVNAALVDGLGGLRFVAQSPPGVGRLIRIPFYLQNAAANFGALSEFAVAGAATVLATSVTSPVVTETGNAAGVGTSAVLLTPQISWATLRIVGFEMTVQYIPVSGGPVPEVLVQDLQIGGGANLFVHEDFAPAGIYLAGQDSFAGLRDYPVLQSPNTAQVTVSAMKGAVPAATPARQIQFTASLVCEILQDDNYGSHIPGPYARKGAMVRRGGSFVS